jgi:hypothetical protein
VVVRQTLIHNLFDAEPITRQLADNASIQRGAIGKTTEPMLKFTLESLLVRLNLLGRRQLFVLSVPTTKRSVSLGLEMAIDQVRGLLR